MDRVSDFFSNALNYLTSKPSAEKYTKATQIYQREIAKNMEEKPTLFEEKTLEEMGKKFTISQKGLYFESDEEGDYQSDPLLKKYAPDAEVLQLLPEHRKLWVQAISKWLESADDQFLLQILASMNKAAAFRKKIETHPNDPEVIKFVSKFNEIPSLPEGFYLYQGQSSGLEPVYFEKFKEGDIFSIKGVNSTSTNVNVPFQFIENQSDLLILCLYKIASPDVKGLPIAQIYREIKRRGLDLKLKSEEKTHMGHSCEEEVLVAPGMVYEIKTINTQFTYFKYHPIAGYGLLKLDEGLAKRYERKRVKIYEVDLFSSEEARAKDVQIHEVYKDKQYRT